MEGEASSAHAIRAVVREFDTGAPTQATPVCLPLQIGSSLTAGREGDLPVGVDLADTGVSRKALMITPTPDGWEFICTNSNRAALHPWGQSATWPERHQVLRLRWPRVAFRLIGSRPTVQHWVLLEADAYQVPAVAELRGPPSNDTNSPDAPARLTRAQLAAVTGVFAQHLAWPPVAGPIPTKLEAVARRLGVTDGAVAQRLEAAQQRAYQLGAPRQVGVTDPGYLYVLVGHGYVPPPRGHIEAVQLR